MQIELSEEERVSRVERTTASACVGCWGAAESLLKVIIASTAEEESSLSWEDFSAWGASSQRADATQNREAEIIAFAKQHDPLAMHLGPGVSLVKHR